MRGDRAQVASLPLHPLDLIFLGHRRGDVRRHSVQIGTVFALAAWLSGRLTHGNSVLCWRLPAGSVPTVRWTRRGLGRLLPHSRGLSAAGSARGTTLQALGGLHDGVDDELIAGAATELTGKALANGFPGRIGGFTQDFQGAQHHGRRAVATLQALLLPECLLEGVELAALVQRLHRHDLLSVRLDGKGDARADRLTVHEHRAGAADAMLAADVDAEEAEVLAQEIHQETPRFHVPLDRLAVD